MSGNKPFFSRTQLNIIMVVVTVAILVLTSGESEVSYPTLQRSELSGAPLYWTEAKGGNIDIRFSFALPDDSPEPVRQLVYEQLREQLIDNSAALAPAMPLARDFPDRFIVGLRVAAQEDLPPAIDALVSLLSAPVAVERWHERWQQLRARRYLEGRRDEVFGDDSLATQARQLYQQLFSRRLLSLSLTGPYPKLEPAIAASIARLPAGSPWPAVLPLATPGTLRLPGRRSAEFPVTRLAVEILQRIGESQNLSIDWRTRAEYSELRTANPTDSLLAQLKQIDSGSLETAKSELLDRFHRRLDGPNSWPEQLETIAFYRLPLDYLPGFAAKIEAQTPTSLGEHLSRWSSH